jgi:hypothetical protein
LSLQAFQSVRGAIELPFKVSFKAPQFVANIRGWQAETPGFRVGLQRIARNRPFV